MKKHNGYGAGTFIDTRLFLSDAFLSLGQPGTCQHVSSVSTQLLLMFLGKRQFRNMPGKSGKRTKVRTDENRFTLTYKEIMSYGSRIDLQGQRVKGSITQPKATRAIDELLAKGFIAIEEYGGAYDRHKTVYSLVDDWIRWRAGDPPFRIRQPERRRGFQGRKLGAVKSKTTHTDVLTHTHMNVAHPKRGTHT